MSSICAKYIAKRKRNKTKQNEKDRAWKRLGVRCVSNPPKKTKVIMKQTVSLCNSQSRLTALIIQDNFFLPYILLPWPQGVSFLGLWLVLNIMLTLSCTGFHKLNYIIRLLELSAAWPSRYMMSHCKWHHKANLFWQYPFHFEEWFLKLPSRRWPSQIFSKYCCTFMSMSTKAMRAYRKPGSAEERFYQVIVLLWALVKLMPSN